MKFLTSIFLATALLMGAITAEAAPVLKKPFEKVIYISAAADTTTENSANDGYDYTNPKGFFDGDLWDIPAGTVVEDIFVIVDTAVAGLSAFKIGDDDSNIGFISNEAGLWSAGISYDKLQSQGNYLRSSVEGNGQTLTTIYKAKKYYSASGKELKLDVTGTATAGRIRVVLRGYIL